VRLFCKRNARRVAGVFILLDLLGGNMKPQKKWIVVVWDGMSKSYSWLESVEVKGYRATPHFVEERDHALLMDYTTATKWVHTINKEPKIAKAILA
jgi:hypothetical protein